MNLTPLFRPLPVAGLVALLLAPVPAPAAGRCPGSTQMDLNACAAADYDRADAAMNAAYAKLMNRIGPRAKDGLRAAQKAWLPFRDATCSLEAMGTEGGSIQPLIKAECLSRITADRTGALNAYLTCEEGDMSCVGRFDR